MLALLSWCWPQDGTAFYGLILHWPTLDEALKVANKKEIPVTSPLSTKDLEEEIRAAAPLVDSLKTDSLARVASKEDSLYLVKSTPFRNFTKTSELRIYLPNDSISYLDSFFQALDNATQQHVRILHYGDSQLEEDRITARLRNNLQEKFGGYGVGMLPAMLSSAKLTVKESTYPELKYNLLYGSRRLRAADNRYGPMLQVCRVEGTATIEVSPSNFTNYSHSRIFNHVGVLADGTGSIELVTSESTYLLIDGSLTETTQLYQNLPQEVSEIDFVIKGTWNIYGLLLDGQTGVSVDNIAMRGYDGTTFSMNDGSTLLPFFSSQNVRLFILEFGSNAVPGLQYDASIKYWKQGIGRQIDFLKRMAPEACVLIVGPADMSTSIEGEMQTYPQLPKVVEALKEAANEHGAAFWSMYDAMGGWNSMLSWVAARPQLAGEDYIHFTHKGANKMADLLNQILLNYYQDYRLRNRLDIENDKTTTDNSFSNSMAPEPLHPASTE